MPTNPSRGPRTRVRDAACTEGSSCPYVDYEPDTDTLFLNGYSDDGSEVVISMPAAVIPELRPKGYSC